MSVSRLWPVDIRRLMRQDREARDRADGQAGRLQDFFKRAADEGLLRSDVPDGWAAATLRRLVDNAAHDFTELDPGRAADLVVATLVGGVGRTTG